ncbi:MAG: hypothetical protein WBK44_00535 [Smithellaceae bacterium]|jgi:hypothetical protein|nr:hypothetical protein [Syntrophaceae bacterium]MBP8608801.1 hypothetical protein [Syntrophaceae bacterium]NMD04498.1 hypothetical protein [Deltaproteobacteria bacterium]OQA90874.1 MAG: hypothetical protein BWY26_01331 [Elusimicrobia bacterium ADurb.Bin231]
MKKDRLQIAVKHAKVLFKKIMDKYDQLGGYLVLSSETDQCNISDDPTIILKSLPDLIEDSENKKFVLDLIEQISQLEKDKQAISQTSLNKLAKLTKDLNTFKDNLIVKKDTFVEIRFSKQNLEQIFEMQKDPLVSQEHTPQSRASIRIVLGTLEELYQDSEKYV